LITYSLHEGSIESGSPRKNKLKTLSAISFLIFLAAFSLTLTQIDPFASIGDILYLVGMVLLTGIAVSLLQTP
jgi:uncharacterized membrane protein